MIFVRLMNINFVKRNFFKNIVETKAYEGLIDNGQKWLVVAKNQGIFKKKEQPLPVVKSEQPPSEKAVSEKFASEKVASEKVASEKPPVVVDPPKPEPTSTVVNHEQRRESDRLDRSLYSYFRGFIFFR